MEHKEQMLNELINYCAELKEREDNEEWNFFWKEIVGMTDADMQEYQLTRKD